MTSQTLGGDHPAPAPAQGELWPDEQWQVKTQDSPGSTDTRSRPTFGVVAFS